MDRVPIKTACRFSLSVLATVTASLLFSQTIVSIPEKLILTKVPGRQPRNIVFILSDDHRYDFMGFMGKPAFLETPNLDRLARHGAHMQNAFVTTSLCSPSRASILTGQYPETCSH